jgi:methionyl-tRNA synthetase
VKEDDVAITFDEFKKMELVVAEITATRDHPNADKLIVLDVDLGAKGTRQLVAGIKGHYAPDELVGRTIVVVANLEPAVLRGERSEGMLLAATDGADVVLLTTDRDVAPGSSVS